jgi:carbon-monoxide dehydrogenase medium subunit
VYVPDVELHETTTLDEAVAVLARYAPESRALAGGTDLLVDLKTGRVRVRHLVALQRIAALRGIVEADGALRIGALTTITELHRALLVRERFSPLLDATSQMAAPQIRNVATVGGNVASAVPCADLPPILVAMNASVVLWSARGQREIRLDSFFLGPRRTIRRDDELLVAIVVPKPPPGCGVAYARFALRAGNAIAVAAVAAGLRLGRDNAVCDARIVLGAVSPVPRLVEPAGTVLLGQPPTEAGFAQAAEAASKAAEPLSDVRGSAGFRRELVRVLTRRALASACRRAREARS